VKTISTSNNYLEVLVNNEKVTLEQLNKLCDTKHDIFSRTRIPKRRLHVETLDVEVGDEGETKYVLDFGRNPTIHCKILHHFIKGKISLSPMETILAIPNELESLEIMVKLARKKHDEGTKTTNLTKVEGMHVVCKIGINQNHGNKTLCTSLLK
jgi:hypothetical protein